MLKLNGIKVEDVKRYDISRSLGHPTPRRGSGDAMLDGQTDVARCLDERPESMVISTLSTGC